MTTAAHEAALLIAPDHPALAGHFPGRPIVPGVVLLDCVLREAEHWLGRPLPVRSLTQAKFTAPLLPQEAAQINLQLSGDELRFRVARADTVIAQGALRLATEARA
jgi:3-hydroxymyristoyl/3-hydroxydecanoyl-(acyl carrier protein) dehydratase